jgi:hypothetical protein
MAQVKAYFLLPLKDNDGRDLGTEINELLLAIYGRFDGWSKEGIVEGAFRMADGRMALDQSGKYMAFLDGARLGELVEVLLDFKRKARQEKIYLEIQHNVDIRLL